MNALSASPSLPSEKLRYELELELQSRLIDRQRTRQAIQKILGELINITNEKTSTPCPITIKDLSSRTGEVLQREDLLNIDQVRACTSQIARACPRNWAPLKHSPRAHLQDALEAFFRSNSNLFVLCGNSGTGKSWALAHFATCSLQSSIRVWLSGACLSKRQGLATSVYEACKPLARPAATEQEVFRLLEAASKTSGKGPFVLVFDDLEATSDPSTFSSYLAEICKEAKDFNIKMIISTRPGVWSRLVRSITRIAPYLHESTNTQEADSVSTASFVLGPVNDKELASILSLRMPKGPFLQDILRQLKRTGFSILRNPYLLDLFIAQQLRSPRKNYASLATVDSLLDHIIKEKIQEIAVQAGCEITEIRAAIQDGLVPFLWQQRREGASARACLDVFQNYVHDMQREVFWALRKQDIITVSESADTLHSVINWSNTQLGARLTAQWLCKRYKEDVDILAEMTPGFDDEVMHALLRDEGGLSTSAAVSFAWAAVKRDEEWIDSAASGVAQRTDDPWPILAMLTAWSSSPGTKIRFAMNALTAMLPHSRHARIWAARLFLDPYPNVSLVGEFAMIAAFEYMPRWVARIVRIRVAWLLNSKMGKEWPAENRAIMFSRALQALSPVKHEAAALTAKSFLAWIDGIAASVQPSTWSISTRYRRQVAVLRGGIAAHDATIRAELIAQLAHTDAEQRLDAAISLAQMLLDRENHYKNVLAAVICALRTEQNEDVLMQLASSLAFQTEYIPDELLDALSRFKPSQYGMYGIVLSLLSYLAPSRPDQIRSMLPISLSGIPATERVILTEMLLVAWWRYAESRPEDLMPRSIFEAHSTPNYADLPPQLRILAARTAALAQLALIAYHVPNLSKALPDHGYAFYPGALSTNKGYLYIVMDRICRRAGIKELLKAPQSASFLDRLCEATKEYITHEAHPADKPISAWQWQLTNNTVDCLCEFIPHLQNPLDLLKTLPDGWPVLRACNTLLANGINNPDILNYGIRVAQEHRTSGVFLDDREKFLSLLPSKQKGSLLGLNRIDRTAEERPADLLELLPGFLEKENLIKRVWHWLFQSGHWRTVLLSRVYRLGFWTQAFSLRECREACEQILTALSGLPDRADVVARIHLYRTLHQLSSKEQPSVLINNNLEGMGDSEKFCLDLIRSWQNLSGAANEEWFHLVFHKHTGWVEDFRDHIVAGNVTTTMSSGYQGPRTCYFFPEFRLTIAVLSLRSLGRDFIADWVPEWRAIHSAMTETAEMQKPSSSEADKLTAISILEAQERKTPNHVSQPILLAYLGNLLLRAGYIDRAQAVLRRYLASPELSEEDTASVRYDLACALVRLGQIEEAKKNLEIAIKHNDMPREAALKDTDFEAVKNEKWFQDILLKMPTQAERRTREVSREHNSLISIYVERFGSMPDEIKQSMEAERQIPTLISWHSIFRLAKQDEIPAKLKESTGMVMMMSDPYDQIDLEDLDQDKETSTPATETNPDIKADSH